MLDALAQCSAETLGAFTVAENIPAGDYVVRALPSGFSAWAPPWAPPRTGWLYQIPCLEIDVSARDRVRTPQGAAYATAEEAFSGIISKTATTSFPGGALHCGFRDTQCADNSGTLRFQLDRSCP